MGSDKAQSLDQVRVQSPDRDEDTVEGEARRERIGKGRGWEFWVASRDEGYLLPGVGRSFNGCIQATKLQRRFPYERVEHITSRIVRWGRSCEVA